MSDAKISFEFFPPKAAGMEKRLWQTIKTLEPLAPKFVSVTYGAGGSTQKPTFDTVTRLQNNTSLTAAAHLTCVSASRQQIDAIARGYWDAGIKHIVALRGDPPEGIGQRYVPCPGGYAYGSDLVAGLKRIADFKISVAAYPERHPESGNWEAEIDNLKRKIDAGASQAITQFFVSPDLFLQYLDRVRNAGVQIPIIPGIMLQPNIRGLKRMADMCGVHIPQDYLKRYEGLEEDTQAREEVTFDLVTELMGELKANGVSDYHLYTLNKDSLAVQVLSAFKKS